MIIDHHGDANDNDGDGDDHHTDANASFPPLTLMHRNISEFLLESLYQSSSTIQDNEFSISCFARGSPNMKFFWYRCRQLCPAEIKTYLATQREESSEHFHG